MAVNITLQGKTFNDVPGVILPTSDGGTQLFSLDGSSGGANMEIPYGICDTAGGTAEKVVTVSPNILTLTEGQLILVRFTYPNTASAPTLNVNSTGALHLASLQGAYVGTTAETSWSAGQIVLIRYSFASSAYHWQTISQPWQTSATTTTAGLMSAADKTKLDKINLKFYSSISQLGLSTGTTILAVFQAMEDNSIAILPAESFDSDAVPSSYGTVEFTRINDSRNYVYFHGKTVTNKEYRMFTEPTTYNGNNNNAPSGEWIELNKGPLAAYPVGAIYISTSSTSPASLFGGTWASINSRFLVGTGSIEANTTNYFGVTNAGGVNFPIGEMGGEVFHQLTVAEMPAHSHRISQRQQWYTADTVISEATGTIYSWKDYAGGPTYKGYQGAYDDINSTGGNNVHNNVPPYLVVYMWKRTA